MKKEYFVKMSHPKKGDVKGLIHVESIENFVAAAVQYQWIVTQYTPTAANQKDIVYVPVGSLRT